jgi:hypothetical protein
VGLVGGLGQHAPDPSGVRQAAKQHVRGATPRRPAALEPVPLQLRTRWVVDLDRGPAAHPCARLAVWAQLVGAQLAGEAHIAQAVAEPAHLVVQGAGPDVRVVGEPSGQVVGERRQRVSHRAAPPGLALAIDIRADRLGITVKMAGDGRNRPSPLAQYVHLHGFSPCEHGAGTPSAGAWTPSASRESHSRWWTLGRPTRVLRGREFQ